MLQILYLENSKGVLAQEFPQISTFCFHILESCCAKPSVEKLPLFSATLKLVSNYCNLVSATKLMDLLKIPLSHLLQLIYNQIKTKKFQNFFNSVSLEDKGILENLYLLCSDLFCNNAESSLKFVDLALKTFPQNLKNPFWIKKSQILKNINASFIPYSIFSQKISILTQIAICQAASKDQIEAIQSIIPLTYTYPQNESSIELYLEAGYRDIDLLFLFKELAPTSEKEEAWMTGTPNELLFKLDIILQKHLEENSNCETLQNAHVIIQKLVNSLFAGFNEPLDSSPTTSSEMKGTLNNNITSAAKTPDKKSEKAKAGGKKGTNVPINDISKQSELKTSIPTPEEWPTFIWSDNLKTKFLNSKSKLYFNGSMIKNPWKYLKKMLKLFNCFISKKYYSKCFPLISLMQLISLLCVPKIDYDMFNVLRFVILKEHGIDGGKNWEVLNVKPNLIDQNIKHEKIIHELEGSDLNQIMYMEFLMLQINCLLYFKDFYSSKMIAYQLLEISKKAKKTIMIARIISKLSLISCAAGDVEHALLFSMQAIQYEGYSAQNVRCLTYSRISLVSGEFKQIKKILNSAQEVILKQKDNYLKTLTYHERIEEQIKFLQLELDLIFAKYYLNKSLDINLIFELISNMLELTSGKPPIFWNDCAIKVISIIEDDKEFKCEVEECYFSLKKIEQKTFNAFPEIKNRCLFARTLLLANYHINPELFSKPLIPVIEKYLSEMDEHGNKIVKETIPLSEISFSKTAQQIFDLSLPSNNPHRNFFTGVENYLRLKNEILELLETQQKMVNFESQVEDISKPMADSRKEYRSKVIIYI